MIDMSEDKIIIVDFIAFILQTVFDFSCRFTKNNLTAKASEDGNNRLA